MRVTLVHNPTAGSGSLPADELVELVHTAGYEVSYQSTKTRGLAHALQDPGNLVLIAGGDGTVTDVVRQIVRYDVPLAILPAGTANNIASTLGARGNPHAVIAGLRNATRRRLDVATARGPWGAVRFVESAGLGLFAAMLRDAEHADSHPDGGTRGADDFERGLRILRRALSRAHSVERQVEADGEDLTGSYLLLVAMNIGQIGPRMQLAPHADPGDGCLDLVLVPEAARSALGAYIDDLLHGRPASLPARIRRARRIRLEWDASAGHLDDERWPNDTIANASAGETKPVVELEISDPPLQVLVSPDT